jgi:uncharacterized protein (DUF2062 family)
MEQAFDFFARLGEVVIGMLVGALIAVLIIIVIIELFDFLIVDPINRNKTTDKSPEEDV